jgi:FAD/FMN-containing dehydrogenase
MPRSAEEILARADELARRFEDREPAPGAVRDASALRDVASAFARLAASERDLAAAVRAAREDGHSWAAIGAMLGTSGEAARQRYGGGTGRQPHRRKAS